MTDAWTTSLPEDKLLTAQGLGFAHGDTPILDDLNFDLRKREIHALIGSSGAGKSTLLRLLAGLVSPNRGRIQEQSGLVKAVILQDYGLFPWKTVEENVALGLLYEAISSEEVRARVAEMLASLGLSSLAGRYPGQLSGGQRQRVAIGRALVRRPHLLLMDEPFSALDAFTRESVQELLLEIWEQRGFACLLITHQVEEAIFLSHRVSVLGGTPSRVLATHDNNPNRGQGDFRLSEEFFSHCRALRLMLRETCVQ